jgi:MoaA/NifB/PqqE/SkfB family radical SAM enzyme
MKKTFNIKLLKEYSNRIIWNMTRRCNFLCEYCYYSENNVKDNSLAKYYTPQEIEIAFDRTNKKWLILLSGGEPFLYPYIYDILARLSKKHILQITTNLINCDIDKLFNSLKPESVMMISVSYHVTQKTDQNQIDDFINKYNLLKDNEYPVLVNYVSYPPLLNRIDEDYEYLKLRGIQSFSVLTFRGIYNGKEYPGSYDKQELALIKKYSIDASEMLIATAKTNFYRHYCDAGHSFFSMDENGNITRCGTIKDNYGNLFKGTFTPDEKPKPCTSKNCIDCYLGMVAVKKQKLNKISMFFKQIGPKSD